MPFDSSLRMRRTRPTMRQGRFVFQAILEDNAARFSHQDEHRLDVLAMATKNARHMRTCSCWMCSGYKKYEKTPKMIREAAKDADDWTDVEDSWEDAAFNPDISASPIYSHRI